MMIQIIDIFVVLCEFNSIRARKKKFFRVNFKFLNETNRIGIENQKTSFWGVLIN